MRGSGETKGFERQLETTEGKEGLASWQSIEPKVAKEERNNCMGGEKHWRGDRTR